MGIYFINRKVRVVEQSCRESYRSVEFEDFCMVACYISPNITIEEFEAKVDEIMESVRVGDAATEC